jgi:hypothetical protein
MKTSVLSHFVSCFEERRMEAISKLLDGDSDCEKQIKLLLEAVTRREKWAFDCKVYQFLRQISN